jgi:hypothetical protein
MEFNNIVISHEWWLALPDGTFQMNPDLLEASHEPGLTFAKCLVGSQAIAVFVGEPVSESLKAQVIANRPDWLDAVVYANIVSSDDITIGVIAASAAVCTEVIPEVCALATACAVAAEDALDVEPDAYIVQIADIGAFDAAIDFDWDTETWSGDVVSARDFL